MPLSKARMRARKKADRAYKAYGVGLTSPIVKPTQARVLVNGTYKMIDKPEIDADGNIIY